MRERHAAVALACDHGRRAHLPCLPQVRRARGIEKYRTAQSTFMMIPVGPKTLVGKGTYVSLLKSLEQELRAVDRDWGQCAAPARQV